MKVATKANVRTAQAARTSLSKALKVSFTGGSVMGLGVAGLAVLGLGGLFIILKIFLLRTLLANFCMKCYSTIEVLTGFSLVLNLLHYLPVWVVVFIQKLLM